MYEYDHQKKGLRTEKDAVDGNQMESASDGVHVLWTIPDSTAGHPDGVEAESRDGHAASGADEFPVSPRGF